MVFIGVDVIVHTVMSDTGKKVLFVLSSLLLCAGARAVAGDSANPYQGIVDRNVFGLKSPPPPPQPEDNKPPPPKITLTGITTIFGNKRALMTVQMPARPPEPAKNQSFILSEGQRDGEIEVLEIDEKAPGGGSVKVNDFGTIMTLTFDKDGAKLPNVPLPPGLPPGVPPHPVGGYQPPAPSPYAPASSPAASGLRPIPSRQIRLPATGTAPLKQGGVNSGGPAARPPNAKLANPSQS